MINAQGEVTDGKNMETNNCWDIKHNFWRHLYTLLFATFGNTSNYTDSTAKKRV